MSKTPDQLRRLTADLRAAVGRDAPILVDQEGGRVQRLRAPHWREWDAAAGYGRRGRLESKRPRGLMRLRAQVIAAELRAVGIDANCAPVADVARDTTHPFLTQPLLWHAMPTRWRRSPGPWPMGFWRAACCR